MKPDLLASISEAITRATGQAFVPDARHTLSGGCINSSFRLAGSGVVYFVKLNRADRLPMFEAEMDGLAEIAASRTLRVPMPICSGQSHGSAFLVLEHLALGARDPDGGEELGCRLAQMHRCHRPKYGWFRDNTIGSTPQINTESHDWVEFWRERRLRYQYDLARRNGYGGNLQRYGERLMECLPLFFSGYHPKPSLLHGDLWGGNHGALPSGEPVIFDPAVYYGDRESDLAMTELFGGFSSRFYAAYRDAYPLDAGYGIRKTLYNLYHILNHANMFDGGYVSQAESTSARLLSEIK